MLGISVEGRKEVLTSQVGENESAKYWLSVLNELKNRGVKDIFVICADGLTAVSYTHLDVYKRQSLSGVL